VLWAIALGGAIAFTTTAASVEGKTATAAQLDRAVAANTGLALGFVANRGQANPRVRFYVQGDRYAFSATRDSLLLSFVKAKRAAGITLALRFVGHDPAARPEGASRAPGAVNYFNGADPSRWQTNVPHYRELVYRDLWHGIDLRVRQHGGALKYEFRVRPGARPSDIRLAYAGARRIALAHSGALSIHTPLGTLADSRPVSHQLVAGKHVAVASRFVVHGKRFGFAVGSYRHDRDLIIDPGIQYTTFIGGSALEEGDGIAVDASGNAYIGGTTQSPDFPTTVGAFQRTGASQNFAEAFVSKLNPAGTQLVYSTFIGGSDMEFGRRIAIDAAGNAYITGQTKSSNFPTTANAFDRSANIPANCPRCATDHTDGFVTKLNPSGSALLYSTYLGGTDYDAPHGIAVDGGGNAYVNGETVSVDFPTTAGAFSRTLRGQYDQFVTKLSTTSPALGYSTYLGGTQVDNGERIAVDSGNNAYVLGFSSSADYPTTPGAFDTTANGDFDVTLTKLNPAGSALVYSTFIGGAGSDSAGGLFVDGAGNAYVSGGAGSLDFPTTAGAFDRTSDGSDAFVTKLNPAGSAAVYSTVLGGTDGDGAAGVAADASGNAWLTGTTASTNFPVTANAADSSFNGGAVDAFISELSPAGSALLYSTYLGGSNTDAGHDVALDPSANPYITGHTFSMDFPATTGAFDTVFNGDTSIFWGDAFVTKINITATTSTPPAPPAIPAQVTLVSPTNGDTPQQPITFWWNPAASSATYEVQIDDSSTFSAPLVRDATVSGSNNYVTSGLTTGTTYSWRVRGINSAGQAGPFSAVRTFIAGDSPPPSELSTIDINPTTVVGGNASSGTIVMSTPSPDAGAVITLTSSNPAVASVPATVTVPGNSFTGGFTINTSTVTASKTVTITASYNGGTRTGTLTVTTPAGDPPPATLQSISVSPSTVAGGDGASGTVRLSGPPPQGGATVTLSSSNPGAVTVPATVTITAPSSTFTFPISTSAVSTSTQVTISASWGGVTTTSTLTVSAAPPPPQNATLTVNVTGRSGQRVSSSPAGISVATGSSGSASFPIGTSITLTVTTGRSAIWSGSCSSGGSKRTSCTFTIGGTASVTANVQ
jgi:hypothetical protein